MAEVFSALDNVLDRPVAVKVLREHLARDPAAVARFRREARAVAAVSHPNIVAIHDVGTIEADQVVDGRRVARGRPFLITELIVGQPLDWLIRRDGPMSPQRVAEIGEAVAAALAFAHGSGIVHRDLKPANVMLTPWGHVKVLDFGIALAASWTPAADGGRVHGTAEYLSPEQARGWSTDGRSDVYSLGIVLYELLTGRVPFVGETPVAIAYQHLERLPERPTRLRPDAPAELERVIMRCLSKDPRERYDSAGALRGALRHARLGADERPVGVPPTAPVGTIPLPPPPPVAVAPGEWPTVPHSAARGAPTAVDPLAGPPPTGPGRHRRRWGRGAGMTLVVLLAVAAGMIVPSFLRSAPVAMSAPPKRPPAAPTGLGAHPFCIGWERAGATVHWNVVNTPDVDGYVVYRVDRPDAWPVAIARLDRPDAAVFVDRSLDPGSDPTYYVRAVGGRLASVPSRSAHPAVPGFCL
jgi:serine/threonine-protein kinase